MIRVLLITIYFRDPNEAKNQYLIRKRGKIMYLKSRKSKDFY